MPKKMQGICMPWSKRIEDIVLGLTLHIFTQQNIEFWVSGSDFVNEAI